MPTFPGCLGDFGWDVEYFTVGNCQKAQEKGKKFQPHFLRLQEANKAFENIYPLWLIIVLFNAILGNCHKNITNDPRNKVKRSFMALITQRFFGIKFSRRTSNDTQLSLV